MKRKAWTWSMSPKKAFLQGSLYLMWDISILADTMDFTRKILLSLRITNLN